MRSHQSRSNLPGLGDASQRDLAQRGADAPLKPKADQRPLETGLFGDSHKQAELFQIIARGDKNGHD